MTIDIGIAFTEAMFLYHMPMFKMSSFDFLSGKRTLLGITAKKEMIIAKKKNTRKTECLILQISSEF